MFNCEWDSLMGEACDQDVPWTFAQSILSSGGCLPDLDTRLTWCIK